MANVTLKSQRQIQTDIIRQLISDLGLNDVNAGSVLDVITNAVAQEDFAQYAQIAQVLRLNDLDALTGDNLDKRAFEYGLTRRKAQQATGKITILRESSFVKVSTTFFSGSSAPLSGDNTIDVNDASSVLIGTSGTLILGKDTPNEEEVTYSAAPVNNTNFFTFTLDAPLANNHAIEESVILKQGTSIDIISGEQVRVPATGSSAEILFTISNDVTLDAGEDKVENVEVRAVVAGSGGNIPIKAIEGTAAFVNPPFIGARAQNDSKFTTGQDRETDDQLRDRIRSTLQSISRGVKEAIRNAIIGLVDEETAKRVVSSNIILPQDEVGPVLVYIDDGAGFEPDFLSEGFEEILRNSTGGETRLQLDRFPLVKAQVETNISETFDFSGGIKTLTYTVGTQSESIVFNPSDFEFPESARAEEVVRAINDKAVLIESRTSQTGTRVTINAKSETNESLQITGGDANNILNFPTDKKETIYIYVNDELVSKDGSTALIDSGNQGPYNLTAIGGFPLDLTMVVDNKSANPQTVTFQSSDFNDPTAATPAEIAAVINAQAVGIVASLADNDTKVRLTSNTLLSASSAIQVTGGTINEATNGLNFNTSVVVGSNGDYTLNKELGTIEFKNPLPANVSVTSGTRFSRAKLRASLSENYAPSTGTTLVIEVDGTDQTITFDNTFVGGKSAQDTADFINTQLFGATAISREVGTDTFLEINTNTYEGGTIQIKSSSTANGVFGFTEDTLQVSQNPNKAFLISGNAGPYSFSQNQSLIVILDNDITNSTFSVVMSRDGAITTSNTATQFNISTFGVVFTSDDEINDYKLAFSSGANTVSGSVESVVAGASAGLWQLNFSALPTNLSNIQVGDFVATSNFNTNSNNGFFIVQEVNTTGNGYIVVNNPDGIAESGLTAIALMSETRNISDYDASTSEITVDAAFSNVPAVSDNAFIIPTSIRNVVSYMNNPRITSLPSKALVTPAENATKIQIESLKDGSDGYVNVTGGSANNEFGFSTDIVRGLEGYKYYTGLLELVHRTIYGDDTDLVSFPGIGAAGIRFIILAPTVNEIEISANVTLSEGISIASVENEVKSAVSGYINNLEIGDDVIVEEIRSAIIQIAGITDVELDTPTANINIADNELARTRDSLILVG